MSKVETRANALFDPNAARLANATFGKLETQGISLYYELHGDPTKPPVMLIAGIAGAGFLWGSQVKRFAEDHFVVLPDHRGTGQSTRAADGYTIAQHAKDMAALLEHLDLGPTHIVGTSTGGSIAQLLALDHASTVRSITLASSYAHPDAVLRREFALRRKLMESADLHTVYSCSALFVFSHKYALENPERVDAWIDRVVAKPTDRAMAIKRLDMAVAHETRGRLREIQKPTLVVCGDQDFSTPLHHSEELARGIAGAELAVIPGGGHFVYLEQEERFFEIVREFIDRH